MSLKKSLAAVAAVFMFLGGILLVNSGGDPAPDPVDPVVVLDDPLTVSHAAIRVAEVKMLRELSGLEFPSDAEKMAWINSQRSEISKTGNAPYTDALAESIMDGSVSKLADQIEGK